MRQRTAPTKQRATTAVVPLVFVSDCKHEVRHRGTPVIVRHRAIVGAIDKYGRPSFYETNAGATDSIADDMLDGRHASMSVACCWSRHARVRVCCTCCTLCCALCGMRREHILGSCICWRNRGILLSLLAFTDEDFYTQRPRKQHTASLTPPASDQSDPGQLKTPPLALAVFSARHRASPLRRT